MTKTPTKVIDANPVCPICGREHEIVIHTPGNNEGRSAALATNICNHQGLSDKKEHRWYCDAGSIAAHHIICTAALRGRKWENLCRDHGYDINHWRNGIFLPMRMDLACQLAVPLHKSNHDGGEAYNMESNTWIAYSDEVEKRMDRISKEARGYCPQSKTLIEELNSQSASILKELEQFRWTLTSNGRDYRAGQIRRGCSGVNSIPVKRHAMEVVKAAGPFSKMKLLIGTVRCNATPRGNHGFRHELTNIPLPIGKTITKLNVGD